MPTIKDIAREAGVSHGTVSNVLNGRGNVSAEKIHMVQQAAERLGYKLNSKAQSLRQGRNRTIAVLLPGVEAAHYAAVYEVFQSEFRQRGFDVQLFSTRSMESFEKEMLASALAARVCALITCSCLPDAVTYYKSEAPNLPMVFLQPEGPEMKDIMYAGFDPECGGREIAAYLNAQNAHSIGIFTEPLPSSTTSLFLRGFKNTWQGNLNNLTILDCPNHQIELRAFEFFQDDKTFDYIVCIDCPRESAVRAACAYGSLHACPRFITVAPRSALTDPTSTTYEIDVKFMAHRIVKTLSSRLDSDRPLPKYLLIPNHGFRTLSAPRILSEQCLRMLTIASPSTTALSSLIPHLQKSTGIHLELTVLPSLRDVYDILQTSAASHYDLIRMDVAWMDELASKLFVPLKQIRFDWDALLSRTIPELGPNYTCYRGKRYCVPYDPSTQLLFYRRDLFSDPAYKRMYFETFREELKIPESFQEYNQIAHFFTRSFNAESPTQYGTTVAIGNVVVSPSEFFPRLFEAGGNLLDSSGQITIDTPEALEALRNYQETYSYSDRTVYDHWNNVLAGFADGSAAMTVVFINYASHILNSKMSSIAGKLGFAPVPGCKPLLGGGVVGITKDCACPETACAFLSWLYSDVVAPVFTMLGGLSPCKSAYNNRDINEKYPWLSSARRSYPLAKKRAASQKYSNFSELQLESILASEIQKAVLGIMPAKEALKQAQEECDRYFLPNF